MILKINHKAQVIATYSQRMIVRTVNGEHFNARIKGKNLRPVCGDWVLIESIKNENEKLPNICHPYSFHGISIVWSIG